MLANEPRVCSSISSQRLNDKQHEQGKRRRLQGQLKDADHGRRRRIIYCFRPNSFVKTHTACVHRVKKLLMIVFSDLECDMTMNRKSQSKAGG